MMIIIKNNILNFIKPQKGRQNWNGNLLACDLYFSSVVNYN